MIETEKEMIRQLIRDYKGSMSPWYFFRQMWTEAVGKPAYIQADWKKLKAELFPERQGTGRGKVRKR